MAEINSKQAALLALGKHLINAQDAGRERNVVIVAPATYSALSINDTIASGHRIPIGARLLGASVQNGTGTASQTIDIGIRNADTKAVVDATAIATGVAVTTATTGPTAASNGTKLAAGVDYVTTVDTEPYITVKGAASPANQALVVRIFYLGA